MFDSFIKNYRNGLANSCEQLLFTAQFQTFLHDNTAFCEINRVTLMFSQL